MANSLLIPVYLNQRVVFDLLAMMQDGISQVIKLTTMEGVTETTEKRGGAAFGLGQAMAGLLRIDLSTRAGKTAEHSGTTATTQERVHTPASLLYKLRQMLSAEKLLKNDDGAGSPAVGDIVEFTTTLHRNPLIAAFDTMIEVIDMYAVFATKSAKQPKDNQPDPGKLKKQMQAFSDGLRAGGTVDIVSERFWRGTAAVITLEEAFLSDPTMADLVDGHFTVLGKVVRVASTGDVAMNLLRKTALAAMSDEALTKAFSGFEIAVAAGLTLPRPKWKIEAPVFQVLPIAIYA